MQNWAWFKKNKQTSAYLMRISGCGCCAKGSVVSQLIWEFLAVISQRITTLYSADVFTTQLSRVSHLDASEEQSLCHLTLHFNKN